MDASIRPFFHEIRMIPERMLVPVLKYEIAAGVEDISGKNLVRYGLQPFKGIRRIGENDIELLTADRKEIKHVVPHHRNVVESEPHSLSLDEGSVVPRHLHAIDPGRTSRSELVGYGTRTAEKVQDL